MFMLKPNKIVRKSILFILIWFISFQTFALNTSIDRIQLVSQQIELLKERYQQAQFELNQLQIKHDAVISQQTLEKASKNLLDKASLDISVTNSNLESINIELTDSRQTVAWLDKNIQEIENQLNALNIFGIKLASNQIINAHELNNELIYQKQLFKLEKTRVSYLEDLQNTTKSFLQLKKEKLDGLNELLKSRKMLDINQQQMKDELLFQKQQNDWLLRMNNAYSRLAKIDPIQSKNNYTETERFIFYANENANLSYIQSLIARYKDQVQQMKMGILKTNSISLLNEFSEQVQLISKQIDKLNSNLTTRSVLLKNHIAYLSQKKNSSFTLSYIQRLNGLENKYQTQKSELDLLNNSLSTFRLTLDQALKIELSSRQGLPGMGMKTFLDLGKEILLVPALTFQMFKGLISYSISAVQSTNFFTWCFLILSQFASILIFFFFYRVLNKLVESPTDWHGKLNYKWIGLQCFKRNFFDIAIVLNLVGIFYFFNIPFQNFDCVLYLSFVWLTFKSIITISRVCLVETTHDTSGHDMRLYRRLKWIMFLGALITTLTVFVHQLPMVYELKTLCDQLFLFFLMIMSLVLLRFSDVVPNLILSHMQYEHPYVHRSIHLLGIVIPILMLTNSIIGLCGYVNLVMTITWYEGIFLIVLIGYLILRGLLTDGMEHLSRLMIQFVNNGWLWTEAFLKPIHKVLKITLFLLAWAVLFLLYGWDKQSPIVERLTRLLHYQLTQVLKTSITPLSMIELFVVISVFYWTAKWAREFVYRLLFSRTKDMGIRNSIAILSQYGVVLVGTFIGLRVLGIDLQALAMVASVFAFGVGLGLRDLANNFVCGFLILLERPLRVGDIISINSFEGEVIHIGSRAITVRTSDHLELLVPNAEIFNKTFTNWTAKDNVVRTLVHIKISRYDNPHEVKVLIQNVLAEHKEVLKDPMYDVFLKEISDTLMEFELRYYVNIRIVKSRTSVISSVLMKIWDEFAKHGIKPPYPQQEIYIKNEIASYPLKQNLITNEGEIVETDLN